jgi:hypothetical protein
VPTRSRMAEIAVEAVRAAIDGEVPANLINGQILEGASRS